MLKAHTNCAANQSSATIERFQKTTHGPVLETFPIEESRTALNSIVEVYDVVETNLQAEIGTNGRPMMEQLQDFEGSHYQKLDIYSPLVFEEEILFQGRLSKFQAGFNFSFVPKWVVVTKSALRYYKNQEMALTSANKPLVVIPYSAIKSVNKI